MTGASRESSFETNRTRVTRRVVPQISRQAIVSAYECWKPHRILYVTGPHASGKSAAVRRAFPTGFQIHDLGPIIRSHYRESSFDGTFGEWIEENESKSGPYFTDSLLADHIETTHGHSPEGTILVGSRSLEGIEYLNDRLPATDAKVVHVMAPYTTLFERYQSRERLPLTSEQFDAILLREIAMGLGGVVSVADLSLENTGSLNAASAALRKFVEEWSFPSE